MAATGAGTRVGVTLKIAQLQNLCKRDPAGYREDYDAQVRRLESELGILALGEASPRLIELIQFAAAVSSSSYKGTESDRIANLLIGLLVGQQQQQSEQQPQPQQQHDATTAETAAIMVTNTGSSSALPALALHKDVRKTCVSALILMRNKGVVSPLKLMALFFRVMAAVPDKGLREMLYRHLVSDLRNINKKGKRDDAVNRSVQSFLHKVVAATVSDMQSSSQESDVAAKRATDLVCELYRRRVWTEDRAVAIVASAVQSSNQTVMCRAMRFFLNIEEKMAADEQQAQEEEWNAKTSIDYHKYSKKTAARQRHVERQLKARTKAQKNKEQQGEWMDMEEDVETSKKNFPAIELLRDPQGLAEHVLKKLRAGQYKYEVKLLMINFVTRLVGNHELLLLPLYSFLQKYMGGHQRDVTAILAYTVQACHPQVPPDEVFGILKTIAHNFITERCSEEQMAVGINAARAICARVPAVLAPEEAADSSIAMDIEAFARDLAAYSNHRDRSAAIAGKAWTNFIRQVHPGLLQGKDRGMMGSALHRAGTKPLRYGQVKVAAGVEGADLLVEYEARKAAQKRKMDDDNIEDEEDDDDNEEVEDFEEEEVEDIEDDDDQEVEEDDMEGDVIEEEEAEEEIDSDDSEAPNLVQLEDDVIPDVSKMSEEERNKLKQEISSTRIFSASDFGKMRKLVERERRARQDPREAARRKRAKARGDDFEDLSGDSESEESEDEKVHIAGAVRPDEIMAEVKRKRQSKAEKLQKVLAGRDQFESKQREGGSTNIEKKRKKNFVMSKFSHDARAKGRGKVGLKQKKRGKKQQMGSQDAKKRRRKV